MEVHGQRAKQHYELGEGTLRALPPVASGVKSDHSGEVSLDWEGEVRCTADITSTGFYTDMLVVKVSLFPAPRLTNEHLTPVGNPGLHCGVLESTSPFIDPTYFPVSTFSSHQASNGFFHGQRRLRLLWKLGIDVPVLPSHCVFLSAAPRALQQHNVSFSRLIL